MTLGNRNPIQINAITLRGIGSYVSGARLEVKPLTVLCGTNGSGKSTWLKALNILERSLNAKRLPFGFDVDDSDSHNIELTNAFLHVASVQDAQSSLNPSDEKDFGPPGTIGLELKIQGDLIYSTETQPDPNKGEAWNLLWGGCCIAGSSVRLRIAHPTHWDANRSVPHLRHFIEIIVDDRNVIQLEGERDPLQLFEDGEHRPRRSKPYHLKISKAFLTGDDADADPLVKLASIYDLISPRFELDEQHIGVDVAQLLDQIERLITFLISHALQGFFHIGAIRKLHEDLSYKGLESEEPIKGRYVGQNGECAWLMEKRYALSIMRHVPDNPSFTKSDIGPSFHRFFFNSEIRKPYARLERIWEHFLRAAKKAKVQDVQLLDSSHAELFSELLNSILTSRSLFDPKAFCEEELIHDVNGEVVWCQNIIIDPVIRCLVERGISRLSLTELKQLNYLLILSAFKFAENTLLTTNHSLFSDFVSRWLTILLDTGMVTAMHAMPGSGSRRSQWSLEFTALTFRLGRPTLFMAYEGPDLTELNGLGFSRLAHPCFGKGYISALQPPHQLSAGFHQLLPIVVQLGLMRPDEIVAIENPEVHLHPALQLKVAEMLIDHARSGRRIIVETHSDLIIRRMIRAILEEEVGQSLIQIYFTSLDQRHLAHEQQIEIEFFSSSLQSVRVDKNGRIANWPAGFLDDDVRESQRLMDVMYGANDDEDSDDE